MKPWKLKKVLGDVVYDLRSRNLLLVVLMLVVAIVAVPLLVSKSGSGDNSLSIGPGAQSAADAAPEGQSAVLAYDPGVRNFKKRLRDLSSKNPFTQQFPPVSTTASTEGSGTSSATVSSGGGTSGATGTGGGGGNGGGGGQKTTTQTVYTYYVTNVDVGESGGALTSLKGISQFQFLPSQDKPVLVYLGTTSGGTQALFLVSKDVSSVGGNGTCFPTADDCQLLGLNAGAGADMVYRPDGKTYHLDVTKIKRVTSSKPPS
jgi:hypothetical protein